MEILTIIYVIHVIQPAQNVQLEQIITALNVIQQDEIYFVMNHNVFNFVLMVFLVKLVIIHVNYVIQFVKVVKTKQKMPALRVIKTNLKLYCCHIS